MVHAIAAIGTALEAIRCLLGTLLKGNPVDFVTRWIGKSTPEDKKESRRQSIVEEVFGWCMLATVDGRLRDLEIARRDKMSGNLSVRPGFFIDQVASDSLERQARSFYEPRDPCRLDAAACRYADEKLYALYDVGRYGKLRPFALDDAAARFPNNGMGYPVVSSDASKYFETVLDISREIWESGCDLRWIAELPALAGYRGQPRGPVKLRKTPYAKTRFITQVPRALANVMKTVQLALTAAFRELPEFCHLKGQGAVDIEMTRFLREGGRILSIDFKGFDQSLPFAVTDRVYNAIRSWFVPEAKPLVDFCQGVDKGMGLIIPGRDGEIVHPLGIPGAFLSGEARSGGLPSGSVMTSLHGSLGNFWVMHYAAACCRTTVKKMCMCGDDGAISFGSPPRLEDLDGVLSSHLGMKMSLDKTTYEIGQVHFLQNFHSLDFLLGDVAVGLRPIMQLFPPMLSFEKVDSPLEWTPAYDTVRWLQQMGYGLHHPRITELADYLIDSDYYVREVVARIRKNDQAWFRLAGDAVAKKDSNAFKGFSMRTFLSSPAVSYLCARVA